MTNKLRQDSRNGTEGKFSGPLPEMEDYEVLHWIGRGGMGEVFVARQVKLDRLVAIKFLLEEEGSDALKDLARFRREAELMAKVSHPNVLSIFDFGDLDGRPYLVMEYVERGDLRRQMIAGQRLSQQKVRSVVMPVGEALAYLHRNGIIHRDLKPENILLHDGDNPRVSDFGIAVLRAGSGAMTGTRHGLGTLGYVAPEQQYGLKVDERADQYSLGALAYEMLTGQLPLGVFKPPSVHNPQLSPALDTAICRALEENPKSRYATIREFTTALDRALAPESIHSLSTRQRRLFWTALILLIVALSGYGFVAGRSSEKGPLPRSTPAISEPVHVDSSEAPGLPEETSLILEELKRLRSREIWKRHGAPKGVAANKASQDADWFAAADEIKKEVSDLAYQLWKKQGMPRGEKGKAVELTNWKEAQKLLYKKLTGNDPPTELLMDSAP